MTFPDDNNGDGSDFDEKTNIFQVVSGRPKITAHDKAPCLVMLSGPKVDLGKQWLLNRAVLILGRVPTADIFIAEPSLSKNHAQFDSRDGKVTLTDLGSTNKTFLNDKEVSPDRAYILKNNDQIRAAGVIFKFLESGILSETNEKERMQSELETARNVQQNLLPQDGGARYGGVQISGFYQSATECSGDWWWHWSTGERAFAIIGDTTGHGAGSALITSAARSAIGTLERDPSVTIERVYQVLTHAIRTCSGGDLSMSAFIVEVELSTRHLRFINASHLPAVILPKRSGPLTWNNLDHLDNPVSPPLGSDKTDCTVGESTPPLGSRIVLLTDGITERKNTEGVQIKEREFYVMLVEAHLKNLRSQIDFIDNLIERSDLIAKSQPRDDDITVVIIDFEDRR